MANSNPEEVSERWDYVPSSFPFPPMFSQGTCFTCTRWTVRKAVGTLARPVRPGLPSLCNHSA